MIRVCENWQGLGPISAFGADLAYVGSGYEKVRGGVYCGGIHCDGGGFNYRHYFGLCKVALINVDQRLWGTLEV